MRQKAIVSWSGGKDSMLALHEARDDCEIVGLLTTVTEEYDRVSMHGVRSRLLEQQSEALGYALEKVHIPPTCSNDDYEARMGASLARYRAAGVSAVVCGDLFLEDIRRYREEKLFGSGLTGVFPLWGRDTGALAREFLALGFRAVLCCVDTRSLAASLAGRLFDATLLADLPPGVDPCGENGEFHTFVFDGPGFRRPVRYTPGERTLRDQRFAFCDLLPAD
jgi:uncharacterized protein (TIGR00290 family)